MTWKGIEKDRIEYIIEFEDGISKRTSNRQAIKDGTITHPILKSVGKYSYHGYVISKVVGTDPDGDVWYDVEKNGIKDIMTPQMMLKDN